jgi:2'-5' RNA ligase
MVGAIGFEPTTPCAQGRCATRLRYAPTFTSHNGVDSGESTASPIIDDRTRYNFALDMQSLRYALVAYVRSPVGEFVENLRRELHPGLPHHAAHLTLLPPRLLQGSETDALQVLAEICGRAEPFEVALGDIDTFVPTTPTLYIRVAHAASRLSELHDELNTQALAFAEEWPYIPHVTIAKMATTDDAKQALQIARERWQQYSGSRRILLDRLTFVREESQNCWIDLAPVPLGGSLVSP